MRIKLLTVALVNLVVLLLLLEIAGNIVHYIQNGTLFYLDRPAITATVPEHQDLNQSRHMLHPVFGQIQRPGVALRDSVTTARLARLYAPGAMPAWVDLRFNNYGFLSPHNYPHHGPDDSYLIGIFGGSVAHWFSVQGAERLKELLQPSRHFSGKRIEVLNFAQGAYKQPQQLQVLSYFMAAGQKFDFVINIDGYNELVIAQRNIDNAVDPMLPNAHTLLPLAALANPGARSATEISTIANAMQTNDQLVNLQQKVATARSATQWLVLRARELLAQQKKTRLQRKVAQLPNDRSSELIHINHWQTSAPTPEFKTDIWANASHMMNSILRDYKIPYLHVIQPNQYFSQKKFTADELKHALITDSPRAESVRQGYPMLTRKMTDLQTGGVNSVSAVNLFNHREETIYADPCCHLNQVGNELLAEFIAEKTLELLEARSR